MHRHDRFCPRRYRSSSLTDVDQASLVAVNKNHVCAQAHGGRHGYHERVCRSNNLVAATDAKRLQPQLQSCSARGDAYTFLRPAILGEGALETRDLWPKDESGFTHGAEQGSIELFVVALVLRAEIN